MGSDTVARTEPVRGGMTRDEIVAMFDTAREKIGRRSPILKLTLRQARVITRCTPSSRARWAAPIRGGMPSKPSVRDSSMHSRI